MRMPIARIRQILNEEANRLLAENEDRASIRSTLEEGELKIEYILQSMTDRVVDDELDQDEINDEINDAVDQSFEVIDELCESVRSHFKNLVDQKMKEAIEQLAKPSIPTVSRGM